MLPAWQDHVDFSPSSPASPEIRIAAVGEDKIAAFSELAPGEVLRRLLQIEFHAATSYSGCFLHPGTSGAVWSGDEVRSDHRPR